MRQTDVLGWVINIWKVLICAAGEGWKRSVGSIVSKMEMC